MSHLVSYLKERIPSDWKISPTTSDTILIRDCSIDKGKGFTIHICESQINISAEIEFEDYAGMLMDYASEQLKLSYSPVRKIFSSANTECKKHQCYINDAFTGENPSPDKWWLELTYKKKPHLSYNEEHFTDILLSFILTVFPYDSEAEEEGAPLETYTTSYERNRRNRSLCLAYHGYNCKVCGLSMREKYGKVAENFIHVHHLNPVSASGIKIPDPINDLVPLCPNCHAIAHLRTPPYSIDEIISMLNNK